MHYLVNHAKGFLNENFTQNSEICPRKRKFIPEIFASHVSIVVRPAFKLSQLSADFTLSHRNTPCGALAIFTRWHELIKGSDGCFI